MGRKGREEERREEERRGEERRELDPISTCAMLCYAMLSSLASHHIMPYHNVYHMIYYTT